MEEIEMKSPGQSGSDSGSGFGPRSWFAYAMKKKWKMACFILLVALLLSSLFIMDSYSHNKKSSNKSQTAGSSLLVISSTIPNSNKILVDVIGRGKAHIVKRDQEHDDYIEFYYNQNSTLNPPCQNLPLAFQSTITTLDTFGTCIRLFSQENCAGDSMAHYPRLDSAANEAVRIFSRGFKSIGRCLANELDESSYKMVEKSGAATRKKEKKIEFRFRKSLFTLHKKDMSFILLLNNNISTAAVSDLLQLDSFMALDSTSHFNNVNLPITDFNPDGENRTKLVRAVIQHKDLKDSLKKFEPSSFSTFGHQFNLWPKLEELDKDKRKEDVLGFLISRRFSPQDDEIHNLVFYQSPWNLRHLKEVEDTIYNWLKENPKSGVEIRIDLNYEEEESNRPDGFLYWVKFNCESKNATENSTSTAICSDTVQMYYLSNF